MRAIYRIGILTAAVLMLAGGRSGSRALTEPSWRRRKAPMAAMPAP